MTARRGSLADRRRGITTTVAFALAALATAAVLASCSTRAPQVASRPSTTTATTTTTSADAAAPSSIPNVSAAGSTSEPAGSAAQARLSDGCAAPNPDDATPGAPESVVTLDVGGTERSYRLAVPATVDAEHPAGLILNLHGSGSNAIQQSAYSQLPVQGVARGYIVATPDSVGGQWQMAGVGEDDAFLTSVIDLLGSSYCIDLKRVHAAGISLGSWKATITACTHPDRIASLALVAEEVPPRNCARPVVAFHGTADRVVPYGEGADAGVVVTGANAGLPGAKANMANWAENGGCTTPPAVEQLAPDVEHWVFADCDPGISVEFYSVKGGGHTWPGSPVDVDRLGPVTRTVDATGLALDWFDAHPLS